MAMPSSPAVPRTPLAGGRRTDAMLAARLCDCQPRIDDGRSACWLGRLWQRSLLHHAKGRHHSVRLPTNYADDMSLRVRAADAQ